MYISFRNRPEFSKRTATITGFKWTGNFRYSHWLGPVRLAGFRDLVRSFVRSFVSGGWELCRCVAIGVIDTECGLGSYC